MNVVINFPPFSKSGCAFLFLGVLATLKKKENLLVLVLLYLTMCDCNIFNFLSGANNKITESCIEKNYDNINMCGSNDLSKYWTSVPSSTIKLNLLHLCYFCWKLSSSILLLYDSSFKIKFILKNK